MVKCICKGIGIISQLINSFVMVLIVVIFMNNISYGQNLANKQQNIIVKNELNFYRKEVISIPKTQFHLKPISAIFPIVNQGKNLIQLIDNNQDGNWDELLVEVAIKANSVDTLKVTWSDYLPTEEKKYTNVRFSLRSKTNQPEKEILHLSRKRGFVQDIANPTYQMEGPGIENDKVAFRMFFDKRNGKDIYGKIVSEPILEKVGVGSSWHELQNWGMDILHTGNSLGAGGLGVIENEQIYRLGDADSTTFDALHKGSLKAALKLNFYNWNVGNSLKNGSETVSMQKGDYFYKNEISVPLNANQSLVSGIANFGDFQATHQVLNSKFSVIYTYGKQAEGTDGNLGLAILFPTKNFKGNRTTSNTDNIPNTSYVALKSNKNCINTLYFFSCWDQSDTVFKTIEGFKEYLKRTADQLANPIQIKIYNNK